MILDCGRGLLIRGHRIRVISMSIGWGPKKKGFAEMNAVVEKARAAGIFVVSSSLSASYGETVAFHGLGREPLADPDSPNAHGPGRFRPEGFEDPRVHPIDAHRP